MIKQFTYFLTLLAVFINLNSCIQYKEVEVIDVPEVGIKSISMKGIEIGVAMQIKNPNKYDISIVDSDLTLFAEGKKIGVARVKEKIKLKKKSNKIHRFTIQTSASDILSSAFPVLMSLLTKNNMKLQVQGDIKAKAKGLSKRFPVDFTEQIEL